MKITAQEGKVFRRIIDGLIFRKGIYLGVDWSTGQPREDLPEYYEEIPEPQEEFTDTEELTDTEILNIILDR